MFDSNGSVGSVLVEWFVAIIVSNVWHLCIWLRENTLNYWIIINRVMFVINYQLFIYTHIVVVLPLLYFTLLSYIIYVYLYKFISSVLKSIQQNKVKQIYSHAHNTHNNKWDEFKRNKKKTLYVSKDCGSINKPMLQRAHNIWYLKFS